MARKTKITYNGQSDFCLWCIKKYFKIILFGLSTKKELFLRNSEYFRTQISVWQRRQLDAATLIHWPITVENFGYYGNSQKRTQTQI